VTYYCTNCWKEIKKEQAVCPHCHAEQEQLGRETFVQKLIRALHHPEPETPIRAAYVLGELKATDAVQQLTDVLRSSPYPYIAAACAEALGKIGGTFAVMALSDTLKSNVSVIVRRAVREAMEYNRHAEHANE
jgi:HEAT repeat protein